MSGNAGPVTPVVQWKLIIQGLTGNSSADTAKYWELNPRITAAGGTGLIGNGYWSSTEYDNYRAEYVFVRLYDNYAIAYFNLDYKFSGYYVVGCLAF